MPLNYLWQKDEKKSTIVIQTGGYATDFALEIGNDNDKI